MAVPGPLTASPAPAEPGRDAQSVWYTVPAPAWLSFFVFFPAELTSRVQSSRVGTHRGPQLISFGQALCAASNLTGFRPIGTGCHEPLDVTIPPLVQSENQNE